MARPTRSHNNADVKEYLKQFTDVYDSETYQFYIPSTVDDCIRGSTAQIAGTQRVSSYRIFFLLTLLDEITVNNVAELLNRKNKGLGDKEFSHRYVQYWVSALTCASQAIKHHCSINVKPISISVIHNNPEVVYTQAEKSQMSKLAQAGNLEQLQQLQVAIAAARKDMTKLFENARGVA